MYFDSHAHLGEACFAQDFVNIVEKMRTANVTGMMEIGCDGPSSRHAVELANQYDWIWAAIRTTRRRWTRRESRNTARCARTRA